MLHLESVDWQGSGRELSFESDRRGPNKSINDFEFKARLSVPQIGASLTPCRWRSLVLLKLISQDFEIVMQN